MINELLRSAKGFKPAPGYLLLRRIVIDAIINDFQNKHLMDSCFGTVVGVGSKSDNFWDRPESWWSRVIWWIRRNPFNPLSKGYATDISSKFYDHPISMDDIRMGDVVAFIPMYNDEQSPYRFGPDYVIVRYDGLTAKIVNGEAVPVGNNVIVDMDMGTVDVGIKKKRDNQDSWELAMYNGRKVVLQPRYAVPVAPFSRTLLKKPLWSIPKDKILLYV